MSRDSHGQIKGFQWHHESDEEANCEIKFEMDVRYFKACFILIEGKILTWRKDRNYSEDPMDVTTNHLKLSHEHGGAEQMHCGKFSLYSRLMLRINVLFFLNVVSTLDNFDSNLLWSFPCIRGASSRIRS